MNQLLAAINSDPNAIVKKTGSIDAKLQQLKLLMELFKSSQQQQQPMTGGLNPAQYPALQMMQLPNQNNQNALLYAMMMRAVNGNSLLSGNTNAY